MQIDDNAGCASSLNLPNQKPKTNHITPSWQRRQSIKVQNHLRSEIASILYNVRKDFTYPQSNFFWGFLNRSPSNSSFDETSAAMDTATGNIREILVTWLREEGNGMPLSMLPT
jgi:hypothetical protein